MFLYRCFIPNALAYPHSLHLPPVSPTQPFHSRFYVTSIRHPPTPSPSHQPLQKLGFGDKVNVRLWTPRKAWSHTHPNTRTYTTSGLAARRGLSGSAFTHSRTPPPPPPPPPQVVIASIASACAPDACEAAAGRHRANGLFRGKDYAGALEGYTKAIDLCPTDAVLWGNRCAARYEERRGEERERKREIQRHT